VVEARPTIGAIVTAAVCCVPLDPGATATGTPMGAPIADRLASGCTIGQFIGSASSGFATGAWAAGSPDICALDSPGVAASVAGADASGVASSATGAAGASVVILIVSGPMRRARLAPAIVVQRAAFSSMLRSVSCTLAGGVTRSVVAAGREKLGAREPEMPGRRGASAALATGRCVCIGVGGGALRVAVDAVPGRTGWLRCCIDGERFAATMEFGDAPDGLGRPGERPSRFAVE
jgi:hypothetical protein